MVIVLIILVFLLIFSPTVRCAVIHPFSTLRNACVDFWQYVHLKKYNELKTGKIVAYVGLFGKGKTLSAVHEVVSLYNRKNGKTVWCPRRKKFVTQVVHVISNVSLNIPYENFVSLEQITRIADVSRQLDDENNTLTVTLVLGDEFSVQMNSRKFKTNIDPLFLNTLLTCRHYYISLYYTAQRFNHVDALLRQVTSYVVDCDKLWRFQRQNFYDAWEMENANSPSMIKPLRRGCWFVRNRDYIAYDTLACVGNLKKSVESGDMLTQEEILALQCNQPANPDAVITPSHKFMKLSRKRNK